jgi:hypothetical protein
VCMGIDDLAVQRESHTASCSGGSKDPPYEEGMSSVGASLYPAVRRAVRPVLPRANVSS